MGLEIFDKDYQCDGQINIEDYSNDGNQYIKKEKERMGKNKKYSSFNLSKRGLNHLQQMQIRQMAHAKDK